MPRPLTIVLAVGGVVALRRHVHHVVVVGSSMEPALVAGDRLVLMCTPGHPRVGQLAYAEDPRAAGRVLLKRVHAIRGDLIDLRGDNADASTDSRAFGLLPRAAVHGCAAWRYAPAERAGPVSSPRVRGGRPGGRRPVRR